jgi:tetratricopeptide (TPR) repeat protein
MARASEQAQAAIASEPGWGEAHEQRALVLLSQAGFLRGAGRYDDSLKLAREAVVVISEALARVRAEPGRRAQGATEKHLLELSIGARIHGWDFEGIPEDVRALQRLAPADVDGLREQALAMRTAGRFEEAIVLYETLREIAPNESTLSDLAFCHQRVGVGLLLGGDRAGGLAALGRALTAYDEAAVLAPKAPVLLAYRGETKALVARWDPERRDALLPGAQADLDRAMELTKEAAGGSEPEVRIRRSSLRQYLGDLEGARDDIATAVAGDTMLAPAFHGRYAKVLMALATRASLAGDAPKANAHAAEALVQARLAADRSGEQKGPTRLLAAQILVVAGPMPPTDSDLATAQAQISHALQPGAMPSEDGAHDAGLWSMFLQVLRPSPSDAEPAAPTPPVTTAKREAALQALHATRVRVAAGGEVAHPALYEAFESLFDEPLKTWSGELRRRLPP